MPELSGDGELFQRMGDGDRLAELAAPDGLAGQLVAGLLIEDSIHVKVKARKIVADQQKQAVLRGPDIDIGRGARVHA